MFLFCGAMVNAQQNEFFFGKVEDGATGEPVVFANIRIKNRALGVITNIDGSFRIPMKYKDYGDILEVSSMGYQNREIAIAAFSQMELNIILLQPSTISLQEAVVKAKDKRGKRLSAKQIVQRAIDAIPYNYPSVSFSTIGYYRDYQFNEGAYINLNEGILNIYDQGFDQLDDKTSETLMFNFELNTDFEQDSLARTAYDYDSYKKIIKKAYLGAYGGNEFRILRIHDAIRNYNVASYDYIGTLKNDFIENHNLFRSKDSDSDNEALYGIKFWKRHLNYRAHGEIFISQKDFAIHKLEYTMYNNRQTNKKNEKNKHGHKQKVIFDVLTEYRRINNKMYLNYISFHNSFEVRKPPKFSVDSTLVNMPDGFYTIYFNKPVDSVSAVNPKNYDIKFNQEKFGIDKVEVYRDSVRLYGDSDFMQAMINAKGETSALLNRKKGQEAGAMFELAVENVKDQLGNLVNDPDIHEYQQFREFFAQRIKPDSRAPFDGPFMDKKKPLFKNQPMVRPKDYQEYWMNTPLQAIEN
ncbi:hypothetical protein A9200_08890 [Maribacter hydrothermalis]|uniref:CarboxypepD_reg-like domain-containing protein n=2 Tax=Maribacter hydrothermalis TaxID=1836467 RepID=A0A1B7Z1E5_9FLAO|nr:hypothetical protein BTR34_13000 [Maribacter hydrothermalis]OBR36529.1 hypothetical protein A9200_08890 [Maribacter hydrothermalis]